MTNNKFKNRLFGRTRGRSKKKIDIKNYRSKLEKYKIPKFDKNINYILDIGTGYGETSIYLSKYFPNSIIISCEKYIDGNLNLLKKIDTNRIKNIFLHPGNVLEIFDKNIKQQYFGKVWIFFPDPWPKKKHFKRRLINVDFLKTIYPFIKNHGQISIVTDSTSYYRFIIKTIFNSKKQYIWKNQHTSHLNFKDYYSFETKYYKKAIISSRKPSLLILEKI